MSHCTEHSLLGHFIDHIWREDMECEKWRIRSWAIWPI